MIRAHGIDLSKWNVSFNKPKETPLPVDFAIQRLSYGLMPDERLMELHTQIKEIPIRGAYHYFSSAANWQQQAAHFLSLVDRLGEFDFYALDIEKYYNKKSAGFASGARLWIEEIARQTGKRVMLYTNPDVYVNWLLPYGVWMSDLPLWIAQYWWLPSPEKNPGMAKMKRSEWRIYQYTKNGDGDAYGVGSDYVDLNVYNGTVEEMRDWLGMDETTGPDDPDEGKEYFYMGFDAGVARAEEIIAQAKTDISNLRS